jgi:DNA-binding NtrC family response regulator
MDKKFEKLTFHQKMEMLVREMVEDDLALKEALKEFEKIYIEAASRKFNGNMCKTAKALRVHRNTLHNRAKALRAKIGV